MSNREPTAIAERSNKKNLEYAFPKAYIEQGLNGTKAYKALKPSAKESTARAESSRVLAKPNVQERILELLGDGTKESEVIKQAISAPKPKKIDWRDAHKFIETSLKLRGLLKDNAASTNTQVNLILNASDVGTTPQTEA